MQGSEDDEHECAVEEPSTEPDAFDGLERGKDYQICPGPACGIKFCYLCAEKADHHSTHWTEGSRCPRWGHPDAGNALHDAEGAYGGDDDDDDEDLDLEELQRMEGERRRILEMQREHRLLLEQDHRPMVPVLLPAESPETIRLNQQQGEIQQIVRDVYRFRAGAENGEVPAWTGWLINFAGLLRPNLQWFALDRDAMHWQTVAVEEVHRDHRDHRDGQMQVMLPNAAEGLARYPLMRELYDDYLLRRRN
ncbi:hypothetical protein LTR85_009744 [Meristemomyces frigidus]|nr:hypothetical protein LTR85_009744 [Meristemomyces frigidus]